MKILIVGAGVVGVKLAEELSHEGHDIAVIDIDGEKIKHITEKCDVMSVQGNACLPSVLVQAGIRDAEMVIAVTERDEVNLLVCMLAHKFEIKKRFARLRHMEFTDNTQVFQPHQLYLDLAINPGLIIIDFILKILQTPGAVNVAEFADGNILLREFNVPADAPLAWKKIEDLTEISELNSFSIVAIVQKGKLIIPKAQDEICAGDKIYMLVDKEFLPLVLPMLNKRADEVQKVVIYGANRVSITLAKQLEKIVHDLALIEPTLENANAAADTLSKTVVLHGDGTDPSLFNEINLQDADFFLALSDNDQSNILSALMAKKHGAKRVLVITNDPDYLPILDTIGMDITINPRLITVSAILRHLRKGRVTAVYKLLEEDAEVMEIMVDVDSSIANKKISNIKFPAGAKIGTILRKKEMIVPKDETLILPGDSIIVVALPSSIDKIEKLFGKKTLF